MAIFYFPDDFLQYFNRGDCYYNVGKLSLALEDYNKAILLSPKPRNPVLYLNRGLLYEDLKKSRESIDDLNTYQKLGGAENATMYFVRGKCYLDLGIVDSCILDMERYITKDPKRVEAYSSLGLAYGQKGEKEIARKYFEKAVSLAPNDALQYYRWGSSEVNFENYKKGKQLLDMAIVKMNNKLTYNICYKYALAQAGLGDTTAALDYFNKAIAFDSSQAPVYLERSYFLLNNIKYRELVKKDFEKLFILMTDHPDELSEVYLNHSMLVFNDDREKGLYEINQAIKLQPDNPNYYVARAIYNFYINMDKVIAYRRVIYNDLDKAIAMDKTNPDYYLAKAGVCSFFDSKVEACTNLQSAIKLGGKVSKEQEDFVCKDKMPADGNVPNLFINFSGSSAPEVIKENSSKRKKRNK
jgi:tetratricopeptide (TPR) repeat protein